MYSRPDSNRIDWVRTVVSSYIRFVLAFVLVSSVTAGVALATSSISPVISKVTGYLLMIEVAIWLGAELLRAKRKR